jgi:hypothetical protein
MTRGTGFLAWTLFGAAAWALLLHGGGASMLGFFAVCLWAEATRRSPDQPSKWIWSTALNAFAGFGVWCAFGFLIRKPIPEPDICAGIPGGPLSGWAVWSAIVVAAYLRWFRRTRPAPPRPDPKASSAAVGM